jgi:hypothetical protein
MAISLYRKYRPIRFEDVVGQDHITRTLVNAIKQDRVSHAYLFAGPRGSPVGAGWRWAPGGSSSTVGARSYISSLGGG